MGNGANFKWRLSETNLNLSLGTNIYFWTPTTGDLLEVYEIHGRKIQRQIQIHAGYGIPGPDSFLAARKPQRTEFSLLDFMFFKTNRRSNFEGAKITALLTIVRIEDSNFPVRIMGDSH